MSLEPVEDLPVGDWRRKVYGSVATGRDRRQPTAAVRRRVLEEQENRCLYCAMPFGSIISRRAVPVRLRLNWDHFIPFAYLQSNPGTNWVAACHVCNTLKGARMFTTVAEAVDFLRDERLRKGYR